MKKAVSSPSRFRERSPHVWHADHRTSLPHEGGKLLVQFNGKTRTVDFSVPAKKYQLSYAAFYADCVHEVKPIRSGYRLCLVYNLVQHKNKDKIQLRPLSSPASRLATILETVEEDKDMPKIVLLGHQYTPSNFTTDALKLHDCARAEALLQAAEQAVAIDLSMETVRKGSPHTLRITKTQAAYRKKLAKWNQDIALLKKVESKLSGI